MVNWRTPSRLLAPDERTFILCAPVIDRSGRYQAPTVTTRSGIRRRHVSYGLACWAVVQGLVTASLWAQDFPPVTQRVAQEQVVEAMQIEADLGYHMGISANSPRLTTSVIQTLVDDFRSRAPEGPPLLIHHDDWYAAYRQVTGLPDSLVPDFIALQRRYRQDQYIEYREEMNRITVKKGTAPDRVMSVLIGWPDGSDAPSEYSYIDSASSPHMQATNKRIERYRLLVYPDMVVQDQVEGIGGRPLGGALGAMFKVIGNGRVVWSRFAVSADGLLVTHSRAKKGFAGVTQTTTTYPDGTIDKDVPDDRPDLEAIADRLKQDLEIDYLDD